MNEKEHVMVCGSEEAGEVAEAALILVNAALDVQKALCKMMRFGENDINPSLQLQTPQVLVNELNDLQGVIEMLQELGVDLTGLGDRAAIDAKKAKVRRYMQRAVEQGALVLEEGAK